MNAETLPRWAAVQQEKIASNLFWVV